MKNLNQKITQRDSRPGWSILLALALFTASVFGTRKYDEKKEFLSYRGLPSPTPCELIQARNEMEKRVERRKLIDYIGNAFDFDRDRKLSYEERTFAQAFLMSNQGENQQTYSQALRDYSTQELEIIRSKIPANRLNGNRNYGERK